MKISVSLTPSVINKHKMLLVLLVHKFIHLNIVGFFPSFFPLLEMLVFPRQTLKAVISKIKLLKVTLSFSFLDQR